MKKVLIIAHLLMASPRIPGLARYLPEFGWEPIIVTAPTGSKSESNLTIIETDYSETLGFWKKLFGIHPNQDDKARFKARLGINSRTSLIDFALTRVGEIANYPDSDKGWKPFALKAGAEILGKEKIDAIISSSSPVTSHIIASELKAKHHVPWLAELRDLWSQNHNYGYSPARRWIDRRLEVKTLKSSDVLVTVSEPWAEKLSRLHYGKQTRTITNGFDPAEIDSKSIRLTPKFSISYTGMIYPGKQDITRLFAALQTLISSKVIDPARLEVRFYGSQEAWLDKEIERFGIKGIAVQHGQVAKNVALQKQRESQLLLLLDWDDPEERGIYPGKIFEYLAAKRPVLATGGNQDGVVAGLLKSSGAGMWAGDTEAVIEALSQFYSEFKAQGKLVWRGKDSEVQKYSYREMAKKFAEVLDDITKS